MKILQCILLSIVFFTLTGCGDPYKILNNIAKNNTIGKRKASDKDYNNFMTLYNELARQNLFSKNAYNEEINNYQLIASGQITPLIDYGESFSESVFDQKLKNAINSAPDDQKKALSNMFLNLLEDSSEMYKGSVETISRLVKTNYSSSSQLDSHRNIAASNSQKVQIFVSENRNNPLFYQKIGNSINTVLSDRNLSMFIAAYPLIITSYLMDNYGFTIEQAADFLSSPLMNLPIPEPDPELLESSSPADSGSVCRAS